jgi:Endoplasmic reticulum vesicle transporter.
MKKESFFRFLVQICAIIGGIFTVAGIIDALIHKSVVAILKKAQMGKLS